jgi:hypothetical protein
MRVRGADAVRAWARPAAALALALAGCQPVLSGSSYDSPLVTIEGFITPWPANDLASPRVGVVWRDPAELRDDIVSPPDSTRFELAADGSFRLTLFAPPPPEAIRRFPGPPPAPPDEVAVSFAFAELPLYDDVDGDGTLRVTSRSEGSQIVAPDQYRGAADVNALLYVEKPLEDRALFGTLGRALTVGDFVTPGYRQVGFQCQDPPYVVPQDPMVPPRVGIVLRAPSSDLPFVRACLHTSPSPPDEP